MAARTSFADRVAEFTEEQAEVAAFNDLATFALLMFGEVNPEKTLNWTGYLGPLFSILQDVAHGRRKRVIITMPPRHLKSYAVSVCLVAYVLGHYPGQEVMCVSYSQELAKTFARQTLKVMQSQSYRALFGDILAPGRQPVAEIRTRANGVRRSTSIDGTATGHGADLLLIDDPHKPGEIHSDAIRRATTSAFENTFYSRGNNPEEKRIVIVMQRLHEDDFVGHVLGLGEKWDILNLPAIAQADQAIAYRDLFGPKVYRRHKGDLLHANRMSRHTLDVLRRTLGEREFASQYLQEPSPTGGGVVKSAWWRRFDLNNPPVFERIIQSWDTAFTEKTSSDYSVCVTFGVVGKHVYLLHVLRERMEFAALRRAVIRQAQNFEADVVWVEEQGSGISLIQQLRSENFGKVRGVKPTRDKLSRMIAQTALMENGLMHVPNDAPWLADYIHELEMFPAGKYDDQVDATSQALERLTARDSWTRTQEWMSFEDQLGNRAKQEIWIMQAPLQYGMASDIQGKPHYRQADGYFHLERSHAASTLSQPGWKRVG